MSLKCGIIGLPNVGKSTIFNIIMDTTKAQSANYPFCTIDPNIGRVAVPDQRLDKLASIAQSQKIIYNQLDVCDIAGLVRGASNGEGLGNQFLGHIRDVDAIIHVVRCFENDDITHVEGKVDPIRDIEIVNTELMLSDMAMIEKRISLLKKRSDGKQELAILEKYQTAIGSGIPARDVLIDKEESMHLSSINLLTSKKVLYVTNVDESGIHGNQYIDLVKKISDNVIILCASLEEQMLSMPYEEKIELLSSFGINRSGLSELIVAAYGLLDLITFFTVGPQEARAWDILNGSTAVEAAGRIHTDFARGFIKAETISFDDFISFGGKNGAKDSGKMRFEGKEYIVNDGDIFHFMFNV